MKNALLFLLLLSSGLINAQTLQSVSPSSGAAGATVNITILGRNTNFTSTTIFVFNQGTNVIPVTNVTVVSATRATATLNIPAEAVSGAYSLSAIQGLGLPLTLPNAFTVTGGGGSAAELVSVSPASGGRGESVMLTISGRNTSFTQSSNTTVALTTLLGGTPIIATGSVALDDETLRAFVTIPNTAPIGAYTLTVSSLSNGLLTLPSAFTVTGGGNTPELVSVTPNSAMPGDRINITVTGMNTRFAEASGVSVSLFNQASPLSSSSVRVQSNTSLSATFNIPDQVQSGIYDVYVYAQSFGLLVLPSSFTIGGSSGSPALIGIGPNFGSPGQNIEVTVTGVNTHFLQASSSLESAIYIDSEAVEATSITAISATSLIARFTLPQTMSTGAYDFGVYNDIDDVLELKGAFQVVLTSLNTVQDRSPLSMYPNPVKDDLTIEITSELVSASCLDISGKDLGKINFSKLGDGKFRLTLPPGLKGDGLYLLKIETDKGVRFQKFSKE